MVSRNKWNVSTLMPDHISYSEFQNEWISSADVKQFNHIATTVDSKEAFKKYGHYISYVRNVYRPETSELLKHLGISIHQFRKNSEQLSVDIHPDLQQRILESYESGKTLSFCQEFYRVGFKAISKLIRSKHPKKADITSVITLDEVVNAYINNKTVSELSIEYGYDRKQFTKLFKHLGVGYNSSLLTPRIKELMDRGYVLSEVAKTLNVSYTTISKIILDNPDFKTDEWLSSNEAFIIDKRINGGLKGADTSKRNFEIRANAIADVIISDYEELQSLKQVGIRRNVSDLTVKKILNFVGYETQSKTEMLADRVATAMNYYITNRGYTGYDYSNVTSVGWTSSNKHITITCDKGHTFNQNWANHFIGGILCPDCSSAIRQSKAELEIGSIIESFGIPIVTSDRQTLGGKELDIIIPSQQLAIEYNGVHWHSSDDDCDKIQQTHLYKSNRCDEMGLDIYQIACSDWCKSEVGKDFWISKLDELRGKTKTVSINRFKMIESDTAREFIQNNHIEYPHDNSGYIGLYNDVVLYGVIEYNIDSKDVTIVCTKLGVTIGTSDLSRSISTMLGCEAKLVLNRHYTKRSYFDTIAEFERYGDTNVYYVKGGYMYSKHYLETMLNENITNDVAINHGYRVYYDSGTFIGRIREVA